MYNNKRRYEQKISCNNTFVAEPLERKLERAMTNKEALPSDAPIIFTERKEGVKAAYNIRTDRFEVAIDGMDKVAKSYKARREERMKRAKGEQAPENKNDGKPESIQGKD